MDATFGYGDIGKIVDIEAYVKSCAAVDSQIFIHLMVGGDFGRRGVHVDSMRFLEEIEPLRVVG